VIQARRKVTQRSVLDEITERTSVAIIARGSYIPPGKRLEIGDRKLYLLIEGSTEMQVKQARMEIQRLLEEETIKLGTASLANYGKYGMI
jgi:ATP-dependent RNA helicase DDX46/PRP5